MTTGTGPRWPVRCGARVGEPAPTRQLRTRTGPVPWAPQTSRRHRRRHKRSKPRLLCCLPRVSSGCGLASPSARTPPNRRPFVVRRRASTRLRRLVRERRPFKHRPIRIIAICITNDDLHSHHRNRLSHRPDRHYHCSPRHRRYLVHRLPCFSQPHVSGSTSLLCLFGLLRGLPQELIPIHRPQTKPIFPFRPPSAYIHHVASEHVQIGRPGRQELFVSLSRLPMLSLDGPRSPFFQQADVSSIPLQLCLSDIKG